jgi:hypothetical protein
VAIALVLSLVLMVLWELVRAWKLDDLPLWKTHMSGFLGNPIYVLLWIVGIVQSYRLFDWIDSRNFHVRYEVRVWREPGTTEPQEIDPNEFFPRSLRHLLLQSYIIGNVWLQLPPDQQEEVRDSLLDRHARRFVRRNPDVVRVEVFAVTQRVTADNLDLSAGLRDLLLRFSCEGEHVVRVPARAAA